MKIALFAPDQLSAEIFFLPFLKYWDQTKFEFEAIFGDGDAGSRDLSGFLIKKITFKRSISPAKDLISVRELAIHDKKRNIDLFFAFTTKCIFILFIYKLLYPSRRIRYVACLRGFGRFGSNTSIYSKLFNFLLIRSLRSANFIWCTSESDYNKLNSWGLKNILRTDNSVDIDHFHPNEIPRNSFTVLLIGRLVAEKGINEFIKVAKQLGEKTLKIKFLLVAPEDFEKKEGKLVKSVLEAANWDNFEWVPFVPDIRSQIWRSDLSVLPSFYKEGGHPRALLEPMSCGRPVVAADTSYCRSPVVDLGAHWLVQPQNSDDLKIKIMHWYDLWENKPNVWIDECVKARSRVVERYDDSIVHSALQASIMRPIGAG